MKIRLTKTAVDKLPFQQDKRVFYSDETLKGFGLRVGKTKKTYFAEKRVDGKTVRVSIGEHGQVTTEQARDEAKSILGEMSGKNAINLNDEKKRKRIHNTSLSEAFQEFKNARKYLKPRTIKDYEYAMEKYFSDWKRKPINSITTEMVQRKHKFLGREKGGEAQANQAMRFLRSLMNFAIGKYGRDVLPFNPVEGLTLTRSWYKVKRRQTVIKLSQLPALFQGLEQLLKDCPYESAKTAHDYILLLLFTGLRRQEGAKLKWEMIDFQEKTFSVIDTKNSEPLHLPLPGFIYSMLQDRYEKRQGPYVFPGTNPEKHFVDIKRQLDRVKKNSNLDFSLHDLRRTFITIAESLDISYYALKRLVNHKLGGDVTEGYIIHDVERLRQPMELIEQKILTSSSLMVLQKNTREL